MAMTTKKLMDETKIGCSTTPRHWAGVLPPHEFRHQAPEFVGAAHMAMTYQALMHDKPFPYKVDKSGLRNGTWQETFRGLHKAFPELKCISVSCPHRRDDDVTIKLASADTFLELCIGSVSENVTVHMVTRDLTALERIDKFEADHMHYQATKEGPVHMVVSTSDGPEIHQVGVAGKTLRTENYDLDVLDGYGHIKTQIASPYPDGRLSILSGPPGSGKTHLIRDLVTLPGAKFIMLPANMIASATAPDLLPCLTSFHRNQNEPIVLILEDGDSVLVSRGADNISAVSSLLNLGDGILGSILDVRIVITTNAKKLEMDQAALRNGRLCRHVTVNELSANRATELLRSLVGESAKRYSTNRVLADVYADARGLGWKADGANEPKKDSVSKAVARSMGQEDKGKVTPFRDLVGR